MQIFITNLMKDVFKIIGLFPGDNELKYLCFQMVI